MTPCLNWQELALWIEKLRPEVEGLFVDRLIIPERSPFPQGYLKGEWAMRLSDRKTSTVLLWSIRPRHPYLTIVSGKGPKSSTAATHSAFDLSLSKYLKGSKLLKLTTLPRERVMIALFSADDHSTQRFGLVLLFIPAAPEAFLVSLTEDELNDFSNPTGWKILTRSRTLKKDQAIPTHY